MDSSSITKKDDTFNVPKNKKPKNSVGIERRKLTTKVEEPESSSEELNDGTQEPSTQMDSTQRQIIGNDSNTTAVKKKTFAPPQRKLTVNQPGILDSFPRYEIEEEEEEEEEGFAEKFFKTNEEKINDEELDALLSSSAEEENGDDDTQLAMSRRIKVLREENNYNDVIGSQQNSDPADTQPISDNSGGIESTQVIDSHQIYATPLRPIQEDENIEEVPATQERGGHGGTTQPDSTQHDTNHTNNYSQELSTQKIDEPIIDKPSESNNNNHNNEEAIKSGDDEGTDEDTNDNNNNDNVKKRTTLEMNSSPIGPRVILDTAKRSKSEMQHFSTPTRNRLLGMNNNTNVNTSPEIGGPYNTKRRRTNRVILDSEERSSSNPPIPAPNFAAYSSPPGPYNNSPEMGPLDRRDAKKYAWAKWTDAIYPVEVKGTSLDQPSHVEVLFGDSQPGGISESNLYELELNLGDEVKIKQDKSQIFLVEELLFSHDDDDDEDEDKTEIKTKDGYSHAKLKGNKTSTETVTVSISNIYLTKKIWTNYFAKKCDAYPSGIFRHCIFALTLEEDNTRVQQAIVSRGGTVLESGFSELLTFNDNTLEWTNDTYSRYKFAAVIARESKRTPKYLQALALGWPCLSYRYIYDCSEYKGVLDQWECYLLCAGESEMLDNRMLSLDVGLFKQYWMENKPLIDQFKYRKKYLNQIKTTIHLIRPQQPHSAAAQVIPLTLSCMGCKCKWVDSTDETPNGSVAVTIENHQYPVTLDHCENWDMIKRIIHGQKHPKTLIFNRDWVIQCVINRRII